MEYWNQFYNVCQTVFTNLKVTLSNLLIDTTVEISNGSGHIIYVGCPDSVAHDLPAKEDTIIPANETIKLIHNVRIVKCPSTYAGSLCPRSSAIMRNDILVKTGVVEPSYRGQLCTIVKNCTDEDIVLKSGTSISQLMFHYIVPVKYINCNERTIIGRVRGEGGFGSSDKFKTL